MAKQCNYKKKGFRQMSMEANPYELDSMNTNMSREAKSTAESIYGNPQGAMMIGNVQLQQQDTTAYSRPAGVMQSSDDNKKPNNSVPAVTVNQSNYTTTPDPNAGLPDPNATTATGNSLMNNEVSDFAINTNTSEEKGNVGWAAGALYRDKNTLQAKLDAAKDAGKMKKAARLQTRLNNFNARNDTDDSTNPTGKFNEFTRKISSGIGGLFKKKP